jgi:type IV pilus assembly protein PilO
MLFKFAYRPEIERISALKSELAKISLELKEAQILMKKGDDNTRKVGELEEKLAVESEINNILALLTESAEETALTLNSVSQRVRVRKEFYEEIPVEIELSAEYGKILDYIGKIGTFPKLLRIGNLEIMRGETASPKLRVKLLVKTYVLPQ